MPEYFSHSENDDVSPITLTELQYSAATDHLIAMHHN